MDKQLAELKIIVEEIKTATDEEAKKVAKHKAVNLLAEIFAPEAREAVSMIEAKPETTQGHYGDYMHVITQFNGLYRMGFIKALQKAGANTLGMSGALQVLYK